MPSLVGLLGAMPVAASPQCPGVTVRSVAAGVGDDSAAEPSEQFRHGDGDQVEHARADVRGTLPGSGHGEERVGEQADRGSAVPGGPGGDLAAVQPADLLGQLVIFLDSPPGDGHLDQSCQRHRVRGPA